MVPVTDCEKQKLAPLTCSVLDAIEKGLDAWILCAGGVYGPRPNGILSSGVFVRLFTNNALQLGYVPYIGEGTGHMQLVSQTNLVPTLMSDSHRRLCVGHQDLVNARFGVARINNKSKSG